MTKCFCVYAALFGAVLLTVKICVAQPLPGLTLREYLERRLASRVTNKDPFTSKICDIDGDRLADRVFREYGAVFAASDDVSLPPKCIFRSEQELAAFHKTLRPKAAVISGFTIELQEAAMNALLDAIEEIQPRHFTPLDGAIAGRRNYTDTVRIWNSRLIPALNHWVSKGRIQRIEADSALLMPVADQVAKVTAWEERGIYFNTGRTGSIFSSVAPPGTSQHLSLLAFDLVQNNDRTVREVLNRNGWYQTVVGDTPHFTYLGVVESELPKRGLKPVVRGGHTFWIPKM
jgi:hypothetical protein